MKGENSSSSFTRLSISKWEEVVYEVYYHSTTTDLWKPLFMGVWRDGVANLHVEPQEAHGGKPGDDADFLSSFGG